MPSPAKSNDRRPAPDDDDDDVFRSGPFLLRRGDREAEAEEPRRSPGPPVSADLWADLGLNEDGFVGLEALRALAGRIGKDVLQPSQLDFCPLIRSFHD